MCPHPAPSRHTRHPGLDPGSGACGGGGAAFHRPFVPGSTGDPMAFRSCGGGSGSGEAAAPSATRTLRRAAARVGPRSSRGRTAVVEDGCLWRFAVSAGHPAPSRHAGSVNTQGPSTRAVPPHASSRTCSGIGGVWRRRCQKLAGPGSRPGRRGGKGGEGKVRERGTAGRPFAQKKRAGPGTRP